LNYTTVVNCKAIIEHELHLPVTKDGETWRGLDYDDCAVLDYLARWEREPKAERVTFQNVGGELVWLNYSHAMDELPLLHVRTKNKFGKRIHLLRDRGLIETVRAMDGTLYFKLTDLGREVSRRPKTQVTNG
jgi:hypothetical protein